MARNVFKNGLPTDIDIRALIDAYGAPTEGTSIPYEDVSKLIKSSTRTPRWVTVTNRWRKRLIKEHNVYLLARDGAFTVMDPASRVDHGAQHYRSAARHHRKCYTVIGTTDQTRLSAEQKALATHLQHSAATAYQAARISSKRPLPQLPEGVGA